MNYLLVGVYVYSCVFTTGICSIVTDDSTYATLAACEAVIKDRMITYPRRDYRCLKVEIQKRMKQNEKETS